ncbi:MAG: class SAM-dependent methyltransferase [Euryarchaeota archaeon]|nr:class SAM-dependent methyltransferase [Euryarchaeota archaeon]
MLLLSNVLEHLHEPQSFLSKISSKISDTCVKIIIDVPNLEGCSEYSKKTFLDFLNISHLWYFNSISLERLLNNSGFSIDYIFNRGSAFSIVCRKNTVQKTNTNNSYWGSISAINYANYVNTPLNATERALVVMHKLKKS